MGDLLFGFVYQTLVKRANDPTNARYFLPPKLQTIDRPDRPGPLLPLHEHDWTVGELHGTGGQTMHQAFANTWMQIVESQAKRATPPLDTTGLTAVACPQEPWPVLTLPQVTATGLDNVAAGSDPERTQPPNGYHAVLTLEFGRYADRDQVTFIGDYDLVQCVCAVSKDTNILTDVVATIPHMSWPTERLRGSGSFRVTVTGMFVDVTVDLAVTGRGASRRLGATIADVQLRGPDGAAVPRIELDPSLTLTETTNTLLRSTFIAQAVHAFNSPEAATALVAQVNATLAAPKVLDTLSGLLTHHLNDVVDAALGPPAGGLPSGQESVNPVDQYLFDRIRAAVDTPGSPVHLPAAVLRMSDPVLDPYTADTLALGTVVVADPDLGTLTLEELTLADLTVTGLSNLSAPPAGLRIVPGTLTVTLQLSRITTPTTVTISRGCGPVDVPVPLGPLRATGRFGCHFAGDDTPIVGDLTLEVASATATAEVALDGTDLEHLDLRITTLRLDAPADAVTLRLHMDAALADVVNAAVNTAAVKQSVLDRLNDHLAGRLDAISTAVVANLQKIVSTELGG